MSEDITVGMGLDLTDFDRITEAEKGAIRARFRSLAGRTDHGLFTWLDTRPDVLKRYRAWADRISRDQNYNPNGLGFIWLYAMAGNEVLVRHIIHVEQRLGMTKDEVLESIAITFIYFGPLGMETVAAALKGYEWQEPTVRPRFPGNWAVDPAAFRSGIDFSKPDLAPEELSKIVAWYERVEGEVPGYVLFLGKHDPYFLKGYRNRFENTVRTLPKQVMPYFMILVNVMRGFREGIRESVLLAKGFGMTKEQTLEAIAWGMFYGGTEAGSIVHGVTADIFESW